MRLFLQLHAGIVVGLGVVLSALLPDVDVVGGFSQPPTPMVSPELLYSRSQEACRRLPVPQVKTGRQCYNELMGPY